ncbi:MAG: NTP transferase domain-containing protein [Ignavibacteria bacterium]|nr:NTP transferase domain-containing protein [Ignavibacteria bacterium]
MKYPERAKVLFKVKGKPMIDYVVSLALTVHSHRIVIVVGYQKQSVIEFITKNFNEFSNNITFAHQDKQLGTGHAVMQTEPLLKDFTGDVLILSGDVPLLSKNTIDKFIAFQKTENFDATLISAYFDDPSGYGRIIRDSNGNFIDIIEQKDSTDEQKKIREINSGIYLIKSDYLFEALKTLKANNAQQEYYLTDVFYYFRNEGLKIGAMPVENNIEITGVNSVEQLSQLENLI